MVYAINTGAVTRYVWLSEYSIAFMLIRVFSICATLTVILASSERFSRAGFILLMRISSVRDHARKFPLVGVFLVPRKA